jgi:hypothetical protein
LLSFWEGERCGAGGGELARMSILPIVTRIAGASVRVGAGPECSPCAGRAGCGTDVTSAERGEAAGDSAGRGAILGGGAWEGLTGGGRSAANMGSTGREGGNTGDAFGAAAAGTGLLVGLICASNGSATGDGRFPNF